MIKNLLLLLLIGCATIQPPISTPPDLAPVIAEVEQLKELDSKPEVKSRIIDKLKESSDYSQKCYEKTVELEQRLNDLEKKLEERDLKIKELEEELSTWRMIKIGFASILTMLVLVGVLIGVIKFRKIFGSPI